LSASEGPYSGNCGGKTCVTTEGTACSATAVCGFPLSCLASKCVDLQCSLPANSGKTFNSTSGTCTTPQPFLQAGADCSISGSICEPTALYCAGLSPNATCATRLAAGSNCSSALLGCVTDAPCNSTICVATTRIAVGGDCSGAKDNCVLTAGCVSGTCVAYGTVAVGSACLAGTANYPNTALCAGDTATCDAVAGKCVDCAGVLSFAGAANSSCGTILGLPAECNAGLYCVSSKCQADSCNTTSLGAPCDPSTGPTIGNNAKCLCQIDGTSKFICSIAASPSNCTAGGAKGFQCSKKCTSGLSTATSDELNVCLEKYTTQYSCLATVGQLQDAQICFAENQAYLRNLITARTVSTTAANGVSGTGSSFATIVYETTGTYHSDALTTSLSLVFVLAVLLLA